MVDHKDGFEDHGQKSNLQWLCRSCNNRKGAVMAKRGTGRRTRQYNPGAKTLGEYTQAVATHTRGAHDEGGRVIHETSKAKRREFAGEIWDRRKAHGNRQRRNGPFDWATEKKVTYHRAVGKERKELRRQAMDERREALQLKKLRGQELKAEAAIRTAERKIATAETKVASAEKKLDKGGMAEKQFEAMKARMEREIEAQEKYKAAAIAKIGNPNWGYGVFEKGGGLGGDEQLAHFGSRAAAETWARSRGLTGYSIKRSFEKSNPGGLRQAIVDGIKLPGHIGSAVTKQVYRAAGINPQSSTEYRLGYNLGQTDRQTASMRKSIGELHATFAANFGAAASPNWEGFESGYAAGYSGSMGAAAPNPSEAFSGRTPEKDGYRTGLTIGERDRKDQRSTLEGERERLIGILRDYWNVPRRQLEEYSRGLNKGYRIGYSKKPKRNPEPADDGSDEYKQALRTAELFHGRPVKEEIEVKESIRTHDWYVSIGPLIKLKIRTLTKRNATLPFAKSGEGLVHLFCSPDGRQFYLRGGDQELDLKPMGMGEDTKWYRDHMLIGEAKEITYQDRKKFHKFNLVEYYHKLGEDTKVKPMLAYDAFAKKLSIIGGQYHVEMEDLVDDMSPGIVN